MKNFNLSTIAVLITLLILSSCTREEFKPYKIEDKLQTSEDISNQRTEGQIVLGAKVDDPYAIENMKKAYRNLKASSPNTPNIDIAANHVYIRFLPKDEAEWNVLKSDTSIMLFDFPLNYEIKKMGTYYHDPSLPKDAITWQYCVLPINYKLPNIRHEIIYEVFIPEDNNLKSTSQINKQLSLDIEEEAYRLTNNLPKANNEERGERGWFPKWTPKGTVKVWDNIIGSTTTYKKVFSHWVYYDCDGAFSGGQRHVKPTDELCKRAVYNYIPITKKGSYIPLEGVRVNARYLTKVRWAITDKNGYFETAQFRFKVNYAIKWERGHYDIRNGMIWQAWYNGPRRKGDWNPKVNGGKSIMYATIHRAAHKHFYGDNLGIRRPTGNGKTKLCYIDGNGTGVFWGDWIDHGVLPDIKIWGKESGKYKPLDQVFATTAHELGHKSHWHLIGIHNYAQTGKEIYESWAEAVEWALTNDEYHTKGARFGSIDAMNYNCEWTNQLTWSPYYNGDKAYTPIFIDLMDNENQRVVQSDSSLPNDKISGYSLKYIQDNILKESYGFSSLRDAVKAHKISGVSNVDIDELFALYW